MMLLMQPANKTPINDLIVEQLGLGEKRILALVVALRKKMGGTTHVKGDLVSVVNVALRRLIVSKVVEENDGTYLLCRSKAKV
jgi:hypothetical protein